MKRLGVLAVSLSMLLVVGCGGDSGSSDDESQISALADQYSQAALDGDTASACDTFSSEAVEQIESLQQFEGCEDFVQVGFDILSDEQKSELAELTDIQVDGDTATAEGRDGTVTFVKEDGEWKAQLDDGS